MAIRLVNIVFLSDSKNSDQTPIHLSRLVQLYSDLPLVGGYIETSKIKIRDAKENMKVKIAGNFSSNGNGITIIV